MGGGDDLSREVEPAPRDELKTRKRLSMGSPFTKVLDTFWGQDIVIPLPRKLGLDVSLGRQTLEGFDDLQVGHIELFVFGSVEVLLGDQDTF